jgi:hypothetical protein
MGRIVEIRLQQGGTSALISCPEKVIPAAGQYVLAADQTKMRATPLFLAETWEEGFLAVPPTAEHWQPGTRLSLFGPLGRGFRVPEGTQCLILVAMGGTVPHLIALANSAPDDRVNIALFSDAPPGKISPVLEIYPLRELRDALSWADFIAVSTHLDRLDQLAHLTGDSVSNILTLRGQVMILTDMPCCGLGQCGVCALKVGRSWRLVCEDGPVFDLQDILEGIRS